jgi:hypothetical protein
MAASLTRQYLLCTNTPQYQSYSPLATAILQWGKHAIKEEFLSTVKNVCAEKREASMNKLSVLRL